MKTQQWRFFQKDNNNWYEKVPDVFSFAVGDFVAPKELPDDDKKLIEQLFSSGWKVYYRKLDKILFFREVEKESSVVLVELK